MQVKSKHPALSESFRLSTGYLQTSFRTFHFRFSFQTEIRILANRNAKFVQGPSIGVPEEVRSHSEKPVDGC